MTVLCVAPINLRFGPPGGGKIGWFFTVDCGADDNSTSAVSINYFMYPMSKNQLGVKILD